MSYEQDIKPEDWAQTACEVTGSTVSKLREALQNFDGLAQARQAAQSLAAVSAQPPPVSIPIESRVTQSILPITQDSFALAAPIPDPIEGGGNPAPATVTPFAVVANQTSGGTWQLGVMFGTLTATGVPKNFVTIDGIPAFGGIPEWTDFSGSDTTVYIDITGIDFTSTDGPLSGASYAVSGIDGGSFDPTANAWSANAFVSGDDDPDIDGQFLQNEACYVLAFVTANEDGSPNIQQQCFSNLVMGNFVIDSSAAVYPQPT